MRPRSANFTGIAIPALLELWNMPLHPAHDRRMRKMQAALSHHLDQITQAELVTQIPTHTQDDDLPSKVPPGK